MTERSPTAATVATTRDECPDCDGSLTVSSRERVCADCGLVVGSHQVDHGRDWRVYRNPPEGEDPRRASASSPARTDRLLGSTIESEDGSHKSLLREQRRTMADNGSSRVVVQTVYAIRRVAAALSLPRSVKDRAATIFCEARRARQWRGNSYDTLTCVAVYLAAREHGTPTRISEIVESCQGSPSPGTVVRLARTVCDVIDAEIGLVRPTDFVPRVTSAVDAPARVRQTAYRLAEAAGESAAINRAPSVLAAASVYLAARHVEGQGCPRLCSQEEAASAVDRTSKSLSNAVVDFADVGLLVDETRVTVVDGGDA